MIICISCSTPPNPPADDAQKNKEKTSNNIKDDKKNIKRFMIITKTKYNPPADDADGAVGREPEAGSP